MKQRTRLGEFSDSGKDKDAPVIDRMYGEGTAAKTNSRARRLPKRPIPGPFWRLLMGDSNGNASGWAAGALDSIYFSGVSDFGSDVTSSSDGELFGDDRGETEGKSSRAQSRKKGAEPVGFSGFRWDVWERFLDITEVEQEELVKELESLRTGPSFGRQPETPPHYDADNNNNRTPSDRDDDPVQLLQVRVRDSRQRAALLKQLGPDSCSVTMRAVDTALWEFATFAVSSPSSKIQKIERQVDDSFQRFLTHGLARLYGLESKTKLKMLTGASEPSSFLVVSVGPTTPQPTVQPLSTWLANM